MRLSSGVCRTQAPPVVGPSEARARFVYVLPYNRWAQSASETSFVSMQSVARVLDGQLSAQTPLLKDVHRTETDFFRSPVFSERREKRRSKLSGQCRKVCQAAAGVPLEQLPLSSYDFPQLPRCIREPPQLEAAVRSAVEHISEAPFLQLQQDATTSHHSIDDSILQSTQLREGLGIFFKESEADLVMLVHPLGRPDDRQSARQVDANQDIMTGIMNCNRRRRLESFAAFLRRGGIQADLSGKVGDCCDEPSSVVSQVVSFNRRQRSQKKRDKQQSARSHSHTGAREGICNYYAVILQSKKRSDAGCYVLKTMDSAVGDCTCIHWTLTKLRHGEAIFDQLSSAWLVSS